MIKYTIQDINHIKNTIDPNIDQYILNYLNMITIEIESNNTINKPENNNYNKNKFNRNNKYKNNSFEKKTFYNDNQNYKTFEKKTFEKKTFDNHPSFEIKESSLTKSNICTTENKNEDLDKSNITQKTQNLKSYTYQININRAKNNNNKTDYDLYIINIRKILNKITNKNYEKLKGELLCYYQSILINIDSQILNKINIFIFETIIYNNIFYSKIYNNLLKEFISINIHFKDLINQKINDFINIHQFIYILDDDNNIDNKNYDKYKCFLIFYINLVINNELSIDNIIKLLENLQTILFKNINIENMINYVELINATIFAIISNIYNTEIFIQNYSLFSNFYQNVETIKKMKRTDYKSLTNKIIFLNMDIFDKYQIIH